MVKVKIKRGEHKGKTGIMKHWIYDDHYRIIIDNKSYNLHGSEFDVMERGFTKDGKGKNQKR